MKETAMHFLTVIVFAGVASLALAALHEPAENPVKPGDQKIEVYGNIQNNRSRIADDWRFSIHQSIRKQTRERLRMRARQGLQISPEHAVYADQIEPAPGLISLQAFQPAPVDTGRIPPE